MSSPSGGLRTWACCIVKFILEYFLCIVNEHAREQGVTQCLLELSLRVYLKTVTYPHIDAGENVLVQCTDNIVTSQVNHFFLYRNLGLSLDSAEEPPFVFAV